MRQFGSPICFFLNSALFYRTITIFLFLIRKTTIFFRTGFDTQLTKQPQETNTKKGVNLHIFGQPLAGIFLLHLSGSDCSVNGMWLQHPRNLDTFDSQFLALRELLRQTVALKMAAGVESSPVEVDSSTNKFSKRTFPETNLKVSQISPTYNIVARTRMSVNPKFHNRLRTKPSAPGIFPYAIYKT